MLKATKSEFDGGRNISFNDILKTSVDMYQRDSYLTFHTSYGNVNIDGDILQRIVNEYKIYKAK